MLIIIPGVFSQSTYHPMLRDGIKWKLYQYGTQSDFTYTELLGDTIIDGISYKISNRAVWSSMFNKFFYLPIFVREDTIARKVFVTDKDSKRERKLYDFSMQVGDILDDIKYGYSKYVVDSIISINTSEGKRKAWCLHIVNAQYAPLFVWVEGIGCLSSPFYIYENLTGYGFGSKNIPVPGLLCAYIDSTNIFYNENVKFLFPDCDNSLVDIFMGVNSTSKDKAEACEVYPNPVTTVLNINGLNEGVFYQITNMEGIIVIEGKIKRGYDDEINVEGLPNGIYFLEAFDDTYSKKQLKFIKI